MMRALQTVAAVVLIGSAAVSPAHAAVRSCVVPIVSTEKVAKTELDAKQAALKEWTEAAQKHGPGYTRWQLALNRKFDCKKKPDGQHACVAAGTPCTIQQASRGAATNQKKAE
jgi:hypothetical protein